MRFLIPALSLSLTVAPLFGATVQAQEVDVRHVMPQRIAYQRAMPASVRRQMPAGMVSRFLGSFRTGKSKSSTLVNLYNASNAQKGWAPHQSFHLAIFQMKGSGKKARYTLLQNVPIKYDGWGWSPDNYGAQLLWGNVQKKDQPVLKFDCTSNGDYGPSGDNVLIVFPKGFAGKPLINTFNFGAWHSSDTSGQTNWFDEVSADGWLRVKTQLHLATSEVPQPAPSVVQWDGEKFGAAQ
jgi:hypothetical protein